MKEPQHPVGPAFERARNQIDHWRRQQITALTPEQRNQYENLQDDHERQIDAKDSELVAQEKSKTIDRAKSLIAERPAPALQPGRHNTDPALRSRMLNAVADYVEGRETPETKILGKDLRPFADRALNEVRAADRRTMSEFNQDLERSRDRFLESCDRERTSISKDQKSHALPPKATALLLTASNNADKSKDESWREAVLKAAQQEAQKNREHDLTRDFNRER
jgi:hypothetical protein